MGGVIALGECMVELSPRPGGLFWVCALGWIGSAAHAQEEGSAAGPLRTLSSMAVGGIDEIFDWVTKKAPLHRNVDAAEVGRTAAYLVSELSSGVTGENIFVDCGYNIVGL